MRVLRGVLFTLAVLGLTVPANAAPPVFNGILSSVNPTPPPTAQLVFSGDSITYGKSPTGTYCAANHAGTCWADLVTTFYNATETNLGSTGSLLSVPNNSANCTLSSGSAFMSSYTTSWAGKMGANYWHFIEFGTNDANCNDPNLTPQKYHDDLTTLVHYLNTNGTQNYQIVIVGPISENTGNTQYTYGQARLVLYNAEAALVAAENPGVRFVSLYGIIANNGGTTIQDDGLHPSCTTTPNACSLIATAMENATQFSAISGMRGWEGAAAIFNPNASTSNHAPFVWTDLPVTITGTDTFTQILTDNYGYKTLGADPGIGAGDVIFGRNATGSSGGQMFLGGSATYGKLGFNIASANTWTLEEFYSGVAQQANLLLTQNGCLESGSAYYCNNALNVPGSATLTGGLLPNGSSGGYSPETFPNGAKPAHPRVITGYCAVTAPSTACTFPGSFAFADTSYLCPSLSIEGATPQNAPTYDTRATTGITIHVTTTATVDYECVR